MNPLSIVSNLEKAPPEVRIEAALSIIADRMGQQHDELLPLLLKDIPAPTG